MTVYYTDATVTVHHGDCLDVLRELPDASVDAVVTDPPYNLTSQKKGGSGQASLNLASPAGRSRVTTGGGFMGKAWDDNGTPRAFQAWCQLWATECLRVLKPGGHLLAFGGTRTSHRLTSAIEDAGFEIRDSIAWLYGSGFPKSLDVSKAIDKAAGAEREIVGPKCRPDGSAPRTNVKAAKFKGTTYAADDYTLAMSGNDDAITVPATDDARTWQGWGTALKPAHEPITVARKPLAGTVAATVLAHGTGALNIDGCRVEGVRPSVPQANYSGSNNNRAAAGRNGVLSESHPAGRWPPNVVLDEDQAAALDTMSGERASGWRDTDTAGNQGGATDLGKRAATHTCGHYADTGGASRYFYTAKAGSSERVTYYRQPCECEGSWLWSATSACGKCGAPARRESHATVKPLSLMRWLVRLVTPPGGVVLDPFAGSGTTVEAAILEGFRCVAIEREPDYLPLITQRVHRRRDPVAYIVGSGEDGGLFDLDGVERAASNPDTRAGEATAEKRYTTDGGTNFAMKPGRRYKDDGGAA